MKSRQASIQKSTELIYQIAPILAGNEPDVVGLTLADLLATWLNGNHPTFRDKLLEMHMNFVKDLARESNDPWAKEPPK